MDCPTCRVRMGKGKNHLATLLIKEVKEVKHECGFFGCEAEMAFEKVEEHQKLCEKRPVDCPGCYKEFPFYDLEAHCYRCSYITVGDHLSKGQTIIKATLKKDLDFMWSLTLIPTERKTLILNVRWSRSHVGIWTVMLAGPEECQKYKVVISLLDDKGNIWPCLTLHHPCQLTGLSGIGAAFPLARKC